jgi:alginate O-acetyltransferase complex protein AlgI
LWATIEGVALLYGFQLRPNFAGILSCENPAQFWRSWRATMTNWLIHYVYIPLGGNRRHQLRNIFAAFAVSVAWHWMGIPFFTLTPRLWDFVPIGVWGLLNAAAVAGYISFHKRGWRVLPAVAPHALRRGTKILLTACVASFTVTLLNFRPQTMDFFVSFMRRLLDIG